jgi:adhesin/invasin
MIMPKKSILSNCRIWTLLVFLLAAVQVWGNNISPIRYSQSSFSFSNHVDFTDLSVFTAKKVWIYVNGVPDLTHPSTRLIITQNDATADGLEKNIVTVHLVDANGNPVANKEVNFTIADGGMGVAPVIFTNSNGDAILHLSSYNIGDVSVTARVNGQWILNGAPAIVRFVAGQVDENNSGTQLTVTANNAEANNVEKNVVRAILKDQFGNAVKDQPVYFFIASGYANIVSPDYVFTNAAGWAEVELSSLVSGEVEIMAYVGSTQIINGSPAVVKFSAGSPDPAGANTYIDVAVNYEPADGVTQNMVFAVVGDINGNPVENTPVTFSIYSGTGSFVGSNTVLTDEWGEAFIPMVSTVAGKVYVTATINGQPIVAGSPAEVIFSASDPDVDNPLTRLIVHHTGAIANGVDRNIVRVEVVDANNNKVENAIVSFSILSGNATFDGGEHVMTDENGVAYVYVVSTTAGEVELIANIYGTPITFGSPAKVEFIADIADPTAPTTYLTVEADNAIANGTAQNAVKAVVTDANGNLIANQTITFAIASGNGTLVNTTATTNAAGEAIVYITSTVAGQVGITASIGGINIVAGSPAVVTFVPDQPAVSHPQTSLSVEITGVKADNTEQNAVKATIYDANGNLVPNATVSFTIASGAATFVGSSNVVTNASGEAIIYLTSNVVGNVSITATVNGSAITNGSPATVQFVVANPDPTAPTTQLVVVTNNASADGVATNSVKAVVTDPAGNLAVNTPVVFSIVNGTGTFIGNTTVQTNQNGEALITLTSPVAGNVSISASINGVAIVNGNPAVVTFVVNNPDVNNPQTRVELIKNPAEADGVDQVIVQITLINKDGNPITGQQVDFTKGNTNFQWITGPTVVTDANGQAQVILVSNIPGQGNITATVNGSTAIQNNPVLAEFTLPVVVPTQPTTRLEVNIPAALADGLEEVEVFAYVTNAAGNPIINQNVGFYIIDGVANFPANAVVTTDIMGRAVLRLNSTVAGIVNIGAMVNGVDIVNGKPAQVTFVTPTVNPSHPSTQLVVTIAQALANGTAMTVVKAVLVDGIGQPVTNTNVLFSIASGTATMTNGANASTNANGEAWLYLTSTTIGQVSIEATVNGQPIVNGSPAIVEFIDPNNPTTPTPFYELIVVQTGAKADGTEQNSVRARLLDGNGSPIAGANVEFAIAFGNASFTGANTVTTNANGEAIIHLTSTVVGNVRITATYNGNNITVGSPAVVEFVLDDPSVTAPTTLIEVLRTEAKADLFDRNRVRVVLTDASGNPIAGAAIQFTIASGTAQFVGSGTIITDAHGSAVADLISNVVGAVNITATYNGQPIVNGSPAQVLFVVDQPDPTANTTRLEVVATGASADGIAANQVKAVVTDANGNIAVNTAVEFYIVNGAGALVGSNIVHTNAQGEAVINITSNVAGNVQIGASIGGVDIVNGNPATVNFVTHTPDLTHGSTIVTVEKDNAEADGTDVVKVKIKIVNKDGNPVAGTSVNFSSANSNFHFVTGNGPVVTTDANGEAEVWLTSTVAGQGNITASVGGNTTIQNNPVTVHFITPTVNPTQPDTRLEVTIPSALANGTAVTEVEAYVTNVSGTPLAGQTVGFYIISGVANFHTVSYAVTDANGRAFVQLVSNTVGNVSVGAIVNTVDIVNGKPAQVTFTNPQTPNPGNSATELVVVAATAPADGFTPASVKAHVVDANGDPVNNATVVFSLTGVAATTSGTTVTTNALGEAWIYLTSTVDGTVDITATVEGVAITNGSPATVTFTVVDPGNPGNPVYQLSVVQNNAKADGVAENRVRVSLKDATGNAITGATVEFTIAGGTAQWTNGNTVTTDVNGEAVIALTSTTVGVVQITATYNGTNITIGSPAIVNFIIPDADVDAPTSRIDVVHSGAIADLNDKNAVEVTLTTTHGDPVAGETIVFSIANGTAQFIGSASVVTNGNGKAVIYLISGTVGAVNIAASYNGQPIVNGSPATVYFTEETPQMNHPNTTLSVIQDNAQADLQQQNIIRATVVDDNGNPLAGYPVLFSIDAGVAAPVNTSPVTTDANGIAEWRLISDVAGAVHVSASIHGISFVNNNPVTVTFIAAEPSVESSQTKLEVTQDDAIANGVAENLVKATITNLLGAPVSNQTVVFEITNGTATMSQNATGTTDANGEVTLHLISTVANEVSIRAAVNGVYIINGSEAVVTFVAGAIDFSHDSTYIRVVKDSARANGTSTNIIQVKLVDAFGNVIEGEDAVFAIESGVAQPVGALTRTTDENGITTISFNSTTDNEVEVTATVNGTTIANGSPATITFLPMPDVTHNNTRLVVVVEDALADGEDRVAVKAVIYDSHGNAVADANVQFLIASGVANFVNSGSVVTNANGEAVVYLVSNKIGMVTLTATVEGTAIINGSPARVQFTEPEVYMPKVFTPNGDGHNDVLKPYLAGLDQMNLFNVYNRWGNLIFSSKNANEGWDGTYRGQPQPNETYVWIIEGINKKGEKVVKKGTVTLVR